MRNFSRKLIRNLNLDSYQKRNIAHICLAVKLYSRYYLRKVYKMLLNRDKLYYPKTLQFPITNKCNLDCVMCNIHANDSKHELTKEEITNILRDPVFKKINAVGVNGGEPFLLKDITDYVKAIIDSLPTVKNLYIISNGTIKTCLDRLTEIKKICGERGITLTVSFSIDGYGKIHDEIRGKEGTFDRLIETINKIVIQKELYCDQLNFICTISKKNVYYLNELEAFAKKKSIVINYNVATEHYRLKNDIKYNNYSLFTDDEAKMLAREFLYSKFLQTQSANYYALYRYLRDKEPSRCADCHFLHHAITLNPNGDICYCATHSKTLINVKNYKENIEKAYFANSSYNNEIKKTYCDTCSHYMGSLNDDAYKEYINEILSITKRPLKG